MKKLTREGRINFWASTCIFIFTTSLAVFLCTLTTQAEHPAKAMAAVIILYTIITVVSIVAVWGGNFAENLWDTFKEKYMEEPESRYNESYEDHERHG